MLKFSKSGGKVRGRHSGGRGGWRDLGKNTTVTNAIPKFIYSSNFIRIRQWGSIQNRGKGGGSRGKVRERDGIHKRGIKMYPKRTMKTYWIGDEGYGMGGERNSEREIWGRNSKLKKCHPNINLHIHFYPKRTFGNCLNPGGMGAEFRRGGIGKHLKMLCFKFQQNRTINEEFNFWGGRRGDPISKFQSQLVLVSKHMKIWFKNSAKSYYEWKFDFFEWGKGKNFYHFYINFNLNYYW